MPTPTTMPSLTIAAPAKLNLFLHILGRRPDGYHQLQTLFQLLDYGDQLTITVTETPEIQLASDLALPAADNLVVKAAQALQQHCQLNRGASIQLHKQLPMGGGLGGGSSDAASCLLALNQLWNCQLSLAELAHLGRQLGADVPVFVIGRTAWAEGIGEQLQAIDMPEKWYLVVTPPCSVSTALIFGHPELTRDTAPITVAAFFEQASSNDCQPLVKQLYPQVAECLEWLAQHREQHCGEARMTGTGASVFATFTTEANALTAQADCPWPAFVAKGVNQSPAHRSLSSG